MKQTQNQFSGLKSNLPERMIPGSSFIVLDEDTLYIAGASGKPVPVVFDLDLDGILGSGTPVIDSNGKVSSSEGYLEIADNDSNGILDFLDAGSDTFEIIKEPILSPLDKRTTPFFVQADA